jgi:hypothetical protein
MGADRSPWEQLRDGVQLPFLPGLVIPPLTEVAIDVPDPAPVADIRSAARDEVVERFASVIEAGMSVAVGGGSRGLVGRVELLAGVIEGLYALGAEPFLVPAMGSHGGATGPGQERVLESLGITESTVGAPIRATMETVVVAHTPTGMPLYLDRHAAGADRILPVNRIKPHTCFKGLIESGCTKMAVVGFGKQQGAAQIHSCGPVEMRDRILDGIAALRSTGRVLGGVATIESAAGSVVTVEALDAEGIGGARERELTEYSRTLVPGLPFDDIDVLVIEQGGKDISGTTIDPNVSGRFFVPGLDEQMTSGPTVRTIVLLSITDISEGNVLGVGLADFVPASLANGIDWTKTYVNCFTAGIAGVRRSRMPMVLPSEDDCIKAALSMCGRGFDEPKRVVRIVSTLHTTRAWISDALLGALPANVHPV